MPWNARQAINHRMFCAAPHSCGDQGVRRSVSLSSRPEKLKGEKETHSRRNDEQDNGHLEEDLATQQVAQSSVLKSNVGGTE